MRRVVLGLLAVFSLAMMTGCPIFDPPDNGGGGGGGNGGGGGGSTDNRQGVEVVRDGADTQTYRPAFIMRDPFDKSMLLEVCTDPSEDTTGDYDPSDEATTFTSLVVVAVDGIRTNIETLHGWKVAKDGNTIRITESQ